MRYTLVMEKTLDLPMEDRLLSADVRLEEFVSTLDGFLKSDMEDEEKLLEIQIAVSAQKLLRVIDPVVENEE